MSTKFEKLKALLRELFQLDQPDLDFGLYRIMHAKSAEITQFLDRDLLPQVKAEFAQYQTADKVNVQAELEKAVLAATGLGVDPDSTSKVKELKAKLAEAVDINKLESEVYDDLYCFFSRYYSDGDFISKRRYSREGKYAIPYDGEEVKLHWANADQYYIKTSEYLRDYAFRLNPDNDENPMRVHFRLADAAEGEHGNVKTSAGKDRVFVLKADEPLSMTTNGDERELFIHFEYRPTTLQDWPDAERKGKTKPPSQKDLLPQVERRILSLAAIFADQAAFDEELKKPHTKADGEKADYTRLRAHLNRYVARNTFDYFIHKDLGGFLLRELDFYIKNEVMQLDDVENESAPRVEQYLSKIKVIRRIAKKIIAFLAQLEDFQKTLWLKKKFVVEMQYCVALKEVPEEFYKEIVTNKGQLAEWEALNVKMGGGQSELSLFENDNTTVKLSPKLTLPKSAMIDTRHFSADFTASLLATIDDLDDKTDGVLLHSENFQALNLMQARYKEKVKCVYIDPPYNTDAGPIDYKNGYRNSSWMSLIENRITLTSSLFTSDGVLCVTIDDYQVHELAGVLNGLLGKDNLLGTAVIRNNPSGRSTVSGLSVCHEYAFFYQADEAALQRLPRTEEQLERFSQEDGEYVDWRNFRKDGGAVTHRIERPKQYYPLYVRKVDMRIRVPQMSWNSITRSWDVLEQPNQDELQVFPIDERGQERVWSLNHTSAIQNISDLEAKLNRNEELQVYRRHRPSDGVLPRSLWDKTTYAAREYGTAALNQIFGDAPFSFAKSPFAVQDCIWVSGLVADSFDQVLDYYGGSGTTGHAVMNLNREDGGRRKFILVEMADYFDTVLLPRLKKVAFTPEWKDGAPKRMPTAEEIERGPRVFKIVRLESYEDTLNNLELNRTKVQGDLFSSADTQGADKFREQYLLRYMLKVESRESPSLLNVPAFSDPTAYRLRVKRPGSDESREVAIDLLETFNWLLGLTVQHITAPQTFSAKFDRDTEKRLHVKGRLKAEAEGPFWFRTVTGTTPDGRKALIIWRKLTDTPEEDNLVLDEWFQKQGYSSKDSEFGLIFVNGGNNLENLKTPDDLWKVRLIEDDFQRLMFAATEGV